MRKLLMALAVATTIVVIVRAVPGRRDRGGSTVPAPGAGNGSHRSSIPRPRAELSHTIDEAIEMSARDLLGEPVGGGYGTTGPADSG